MGLKEPWDKMQKMPSTADVYKKRYCLGDKTACARYMVKMEAGKENVPSDLFPNQVKRTREIISGLQT